MKMGEIRKACGEVTKELPEKTYTRKDVKNVVLDILKKLEGIDERAKVGTIEVNKGGVEIPND